MQIKQLKDIDMNEQYFTGLFEGTESIQTNPLLDKIKSKLVAVAKKARKSASSGAKNKLGVLNVNAGAIKGLNNKKNNMVIEFAASILKGKVNLTESVYTEDNLFNIDTPEKKATIKNNIKKEVFSNLDQFNTSLSKPYVSNESTTPKTQQDSIIDTVNTQKEKIETVNSNVGIKIIMLGVMLLGMSVVYNFTPSHIIANNEKITFTWDGILLLIFRTMFGNAFGQVGMLLIGLGFIYYLVDNDKLYVSGWAIILMGKIISRFR